MAEGRQAQYLVAAAVSLATMVAGFSLAWSTPVIPKFHNNETGINITDKQISWMAAISSPGFMTGSLVTRFISDGYGRRAVILGSAVPVLVGTIINLSTSTAWCLFVTRYLWGAGTGMIATVAAVYLAEVSDKEVRGRVTSSIRYMPSFGSFLIMSVGPFVSYHTISYLLLVLPICYFIACCFIPESPYYLLKKGKVNAARASLIRLSENKDEKVIDSRLSVMGADVRKETLHSGSIKELFTGKQYRKALMICIGIFSSAIVDRVGRRPLLVYSFLSSGISLSFVGACFLIKPDSSPYDSYSYIPIVGIILTSMIATLGYDTIVFLIIAEIFPLNVKSVAMTLQNILGGFLNFLSVKGYQEMKDVAGLECSGSTAVLL